MTTRDMMLSIAAALALFPAGGRAQLLLDGHLESVIADYPAFVRAKALDFEARDDELVRLLKKRQNAAVTALFGRHAEFLYGRGTVEFLFDTALSLRKSQWELCATFAERRLVLMQFLEWTKSIERIQRGRMERALVPVKEHEEAMARRLQAEIELLRFEAKSKAP